MRLAQCRCFSSPAALALPTAAYINSFFILFGDSWLSWLSAHVLSWQSKIKTTPGRELFLLWTRVGSNNRCVFPRGSVGKQGNYNLFFLTGLDRLLLAVDTRTCILCTGSSLREVWLSNPGRTTRPRRSAIKKYFKKAIKKNQYSNLLSPFLFIGMFKWKHVPRTRWVHEWLAVLCE